MDIINKEELKDIGRICADIRKSHNLTQKDVGDITGYSVSNICMFESGKVNNMLLYKFYIDLERGRYNER